MRAIGIDPGLAMTGFGVVETLSRGGKAWSGERSEQRQVSRPHPVKNHL